MIYDYDVEEITLEKNMTRAKRRKKNISKALRKQNISKTAYGFDWYKNLHQYSKNKIHCSCNLCRFRPVWDPDAKPISDIKKEMHMTALLNDYFTEAVP